MFGWVYSSKEPRKNRKIVGRYNVKGLEFPGVKNTNFCGRPILSNKSPLSLLLKLPENSNLRHMMCLCEDHHYMFHELFVKSYLAKDQKPLPFKPKEMVQLLTNMEDQVGSDYDSNSAKETVLASSVKLRQNRQTTKRLVDELDAHVKASKGKKRIKISNAKKVPVEKVRAKKQVLQAKKKIEKN